MGLPHIQPMTLLTLRYEVAVPVLLLYRPTWPKGRRHWAAITLTGFLIQCVYFGLAYLVVAKCIFLISLFVGLVQRRDATKISARMYLVPPSALLIAWAILGEQMGPLAILGMVICAAGVWMVNRSGRTRA